LVGKSRTSLVLSGFFQGAGAARRLPFPFLLAVQKKTTTTDPLHLSFILFFYLAARLFGAKATFLRVSLPQGKATFLRVISSP
jgi:hypothetical protein